MSNDLGTQDDFLESMLGDFIDESDGLLSQLNENLLILDDWAKSLALDQQEPCDRDLINEMFRAAHSLKGLSAMLRLDDINVLTHKMENVFDAARNGQLFIKPNVVDIVFQAVDRLGAMIERLKDPSHQAVDSASVIEQIQEILEANGAQKEMSVQDDAENAMQEALANAAAGESAPDARAEQTLDQLSRGVAQLQAENTPMAQARPAPPTEHFSGIQDETDLPANYLSIFIDESEQSLDDLSDLLLAEKVHSVVENLMITCHRIKGSAASLGLNRPAKLSHLMEDVLQELLQTKGSLTDEITDALLICTDALRQYVETLKTGNPQSSGFEQAYQALVQARLQREEVDAAESYGAANGESEANAVADQPANVPQLTEQEAARIAQDATDSAAGVVAQVVFEENLPLVELKATLVVERVTTFGQLFSCSPHETEFETHPNLVNLLLGIATTQTPAEVATRLNLEGVTRVDVIPFQARTQSEPSPAATPTPAATPASTATASATTAPVASAAPAVRPSAPPQNSAPAPAAPAAVGGDADATQRRGGGSRPAETLRVDIERLDQLMNLAGQLVINKARFVQISEGLRGVTQLKTLSHSLANAFTLVERLSANLSTARREADGCPILESMTTNTRQLRDDLEGIQREVDRLSNVRGLVSDLSEAVHQLDRAADGIQKSVMDTRMVPIGPLFGRFKRVVRDLTRGSDKEVQLEIRGEKTELDKRMIDELGDPLIHMVRNSVDHGVESPADRVAAGKPRMGTVKLDAFHRGNRIVIQITDDGRGLNPERIRDKAIAKGLITEADAERMTNQQIFQLIWEPGFSTAEKVTEVSGRGMGMDIVRSKIEELNGTVELDSKPGQGTIFTIRLPLTMAILPTLLCRICGDVFAIPVESVVEIVRFKRSELSTVRGKQTAMVRGRVVSVVTLAEMFIWNRPPADGFVEPDNSDVTLVVIGIDDREAGLIVHGLIGEEDIVIKSMSDNYRNVEGIAGASILGDGRVSLILDVGAVLEMACRTRGTQRNIELAVPAAIVATEEQAASQAAELTPTCSA